MIELNTTTLHLEWHPETGHYYLEGMVAGAQPSLSAAAVVEYRNHHLRKYLQEKDWMKASVAPPTRITSPLGPLQGISLVGTDHVRLLEYRLDFALAEDHPFFISQITLKNVNSRPLRIDRIDFCRTTRGGINLQTDQRSQLAFFSNGWQSWSYTGSYGPGHNQHRTHLGPLRQPLLINPGTPHPRHAGHFGSDFFGVLGNRTRRVGILCGFLSQKLQFGSIEARTEPQASLRLWANCDGIRLDPGSDLITDPAVLAFIDLEREDPLDEYIEAVALQHDLGTEFRPVTGWCSWYQFHNHLHEDDIRRNLQACTGDRNLRSFKFIQIDDGYESKIGDWSAFQKGFPQGVAPLAKEIHSAGLTPGLWLAPFLVNPGSQLARNHPDFILRGPSGFPVVAGATNESWITHALDLSYPPALEYACQAIHTAVHEWGFPYLKLDFLSAGALAGRHYDQAVTRAQILRKAFEGVRLAAGESACLVGCGSPLGSSIGIFDAMRISEDISLAWEPEVPVLKTFFRKEVEFPSTRNAIHNILTRASLNLRWWANDPDCLVIRPETSLTMAEIQSLGTAICLAGSSFMLSDDLSQLPAERLKLALTFHPVIRGHPQVLDWFENDYPSRVRLHLDGPAGPWYLLALFNWSDHHVDTDINLDEFKLPSGGSYWIRSFWDQSTCMVRDRNYKIQNLAPHGVAVLAVRPVQQSAAQYLGSSLHISQGMEITGWQVSSGEITLHLALPHTLRGQVELSLPFVPKKGIAGDETGEKFLNWRESIKGCFLFDIELEESAVLKISG